jgi:hypothetical protein
LSFVLGFGHFFAKALLSSPPHIPRNAKNMQSKQIPKIKSKVPKNPLKSQKPKAKRKHPGLFWGKHAEGVVLKSP